MRARKLSKMWVTWFWFHLTRRQLNAMVGGSVSPRAVKSSHYPEMGKAQ